MNEQLTITLDKAYLANVLIFCLDGVKDIIHLANRLAKSGDIQTANNIKKPCNQITDYLSDLASQLDTTEKE